jgi:trans-aconitate methyltransferase
MKPSNAPDAWDSSEAYERYVGRWSRRVAPKFLDWLQAPAQAAWADVGCGTGALTSTILTRCDPAAISGLDASAQFVDQAQHRIDDARVRFDVGDATRLPWSSHSFHFSVSGLVLNFVPDHEAMLREMARVTKPTGTVAVYVWDYAEGMQMMRGFWYAAAEVHPESVEFDEARRFPVCHPDALRALFEKVGLAKVDTKAIDVATLFADFDDYWGPFLGGSGPAPAYLATLTEPLRQAIRERLAARLRPGADGKIAMSARVWAIRGRVA